MLNDDIAENVLQCGKDGIKQNIMADDPDYENLSEEEFDKAADKIVAETAFVNTICIYVG